MNKHAWLIIAHNEIEVTRRLVSLLDDNRNDIFIHIDKKYFNSDWNKLTECVTKSKIKIFSKIDVKWGGYSQIATELELYKVAANTKEYYCYYHLISGVDFPIKSNKEILDFFDRNSGYEFLEVVKKEVAESYNIKDRYSVFHFYLKRGRFFWKIKRLSIKLQKKLGINRSPEIRPYFGSNWASLTDDAVQVLIRSENKIKKIFRYSLTCDEVYKATILMENEEFRKRLYRKPIKDTCISYNMRYIDWKRGNPYVFTMSDFDVLINCNALLARKFSWEKDSEIVSKLYVYLSKKQ